MKRWLWRGEENVAALCMAALLATLALQVFTRYVLNDPFAWTEEASRYLYVYIVFLGSSAAVSDRSHVAIGFLVAALPRALQWAVSFAVNLLILFLLANLVWWGWVATVRQWSIPLMVLEIPYAWVYGVIPVTATLMTLRTIIVMREDWQDFRERRPARTDTTGAI
ncbi:MAG: TRAP transporter small permease [Alphaproteobacteria bacterium]|nr:TRAP transporter small permease [Alphaproteobacteria bacterium]